MTKRHDGWILLIAQALLLFLAAGAAAQAPTAEPALEGPQTPTEARAFSDGVVLTAGVGPATRGFGGQISVWGSKGLHSVGLRSASSFDLNIFGPSSSETDIALLYGRRSGSGSTWGRIAAGPAFVESIQDGEATDCAFFICSYENVVERTVGLALQVDGVWAFSEPVGLGASLFGNLNPSSSFFGLAVSLHLGKVGR